MASKNKFLLLILLGISSFVKSPAYAESKLPILTTKQDVRNLRFVSSDGKFTYYQRGNGSLQFSTNYSVKEVLKFSPNSQYTLIKGRSSRYLVAQVNELYNNYLSIRSPQKIHIIKYGTHESQFLAKGVAINLHLKDEWISYYDSLKKKLIVQNHVNPSIKYEIKLANKVNPYFTPQVAMLDEDTIIYTDLNKEGLPGILRYTVNAKKVELLHKLSTPLIKIELCENDSHLYWFQYGLDPIERSSQLRRIEKANLKKKKIDLLKTPTLYQSSENDIGDIVCNQKKGHIQLIKTFRSSTGKLTYDAAEIELSTGKSSKLSDIQFATSLIQMDKKLLLPYQDKFFVLYGDDNLTQFDTLKNRGIK